ncbi:MAG: helix-turn-helix transcriptional regulator [Lachnospiraceae bacterium]|nr:helix-turn-helix transcriptional regulator [Lachnospiraceae bacterium]
MAEAKRICFDIDKELSGLLLRIYIRNGGYSVRQIQEYLYLSCPQPIYRWMRGAILPSVGHLYSLSRLFGCHMEDLLAIRQERAVIEKLVGLRRVLAIYWLWVCRRRRFFEGI